MLPKVIRGLRVLGILLVPSLGWAQVTNDHLVPPMSSLTELPFITRYHALLGQRLALDSARTALVLIVVKPSFEPEYALWVRRSGPRFQLVYRVAQQSIWGTKSQPQPGGTVSTKRMALSPGLAQGLIDVLTVALAKARFPATSSEMADGTTFTFATAVPNDGYRSGEVWSPRPNSDMGSLVQLVAGLRELATTADDRDFRQDVLLTEARQLLFRLASR
jgi:hypothetical protein